MAKSTKKRAIIYSNVKENKKLAEEKQKIMQNQINLDDEVIIGFNNSQKSTEKINPKAKVKKKKTRKNVQKEVQKYDSPVKKSENTPKKYKNNNVNINPQQRKKVTLIAKLVIISVVLIIAIVVFLKSSVFNIKDIVISVENNNVLTEKEINSLSHIYVGQNMFSINKKDSIESLKTNPYVESVKIKRDIPSKVHILIVEREIKFQLNENGEYIYIDKQGYAMDKSSESKCSFDITGYKTQEIKYGEKLSDEDLEGLTAIMQIVQEAENNGIKDSITRIDISNHEDYLIYFDDELKIAHLGDSSALYSKMARIKKIMEIEKEYAGEIFVNVNLNDGEYPYFRERV